MFRYGDGSPFPFDGCFLDAVAGAVDACTAMFEAVAELEALRWEAAKARRDADAEVARLVGLEDAVKNVLSQADPSRARDATLCQQVAQRTLRAMRGEIKSSIATLQRRAAAVASKQRPEVTAQQVHAAAIRFFTTHELPDSSWTWTWIANQKARGELCSHARRFVVDYEIYLPELWRSPVGIAALIPTLTAILPTKRLFRRESPVPIRLNRCVLTRAWHDGTTTGLEIRTGPAQRPGWRITREPGRAPVCLTLDKRGAPRGPEIALHHPADGLAQLFDTVVAAFEAMKDRRVACDVALDDAPVSAISDPIRVPCALLEMLAPTIQAIRARSGVSGELILKHDVGEGRREELFLPRATLCARFDQLPRQYRARFEAIGLDGAPTNVGIPVMVGYDASAPLPPRLPGLSGM